MAYYDSIQYTTHTLLAIRIINLLYSSSVKSFLNIRIYIYVNDGMAIFLIKK